MHLIHLLQFHTKIVSGLILGFVPSQWEKPFQCNTVPHWLGTNLESALSSKQLPRISHFSCWYVTPSCADPVYIHGTWTFFYKCTFRSPSTEFCYAISRHSADCKVIDAVYIISLAIVDFIVRRAGLLWSQQDFEWRWSVPLFKCLTVLEFSFILFDLCLLITFFNFIMNYVPIVTFWIFTYHKIWILSIMFCFIWSYWIIYFLACLEVSWRVVS